MNATAYVKDAALKAKSPAKQRVTVAEYLAAQIDLSGKSQLDIAREVGFEKPNIITMFKQGKSKLPMSRVEKMAKALGVDPTYLYSLCMAEYEPDVWPIVQAMMKRNGLTETQAEILEILDSTGVVNPVIRTGEERERIFSAFKKLRGANEIAGDRLLQGNSPVDGALLGAVFIVRPLTLKPLYHSDFVRPTVAVLQTYT